MAVLKLFSSLSSNIAIQRPIFGHAGTIIASPLYGPVQFGNGIVLNSSSINYATFQNFYTNKFTIKFFFKPSWNYDDSVYHTFLYPTDDGGVYVIKHSENRWECWMYSNHSTSQPLAGYAFSMITPFSANDIVHFAITADNTAGSEKKIKLYINNIPQTFSHIIAGYDLVWIPYTTTLRIGGNMIPNITMENLKIVQTVQTDFSDRFQERSGMCDVIL